MAKDDFDGILRLVRDGEVLKGESSDPLYPDCIELQSFTFGSSEAFDEDEAAPSASQADLRGAMSAPGPARFQFTTPPPEDIDPATVAACQFKITKGVDWSSPDLFLAYCSAHDLNTRHVFDSGSVILRKATGTGPKPFLVFHFSEIVIFGYVLEVGEDGTEKETVNLGFAKCRMEYSQQEDTGSLAVKTQSGWSFTDRTAW